jgi:hypothetical protein
MLFLHEVHEVIGNRDETFESAVRDGWMPALAATEEARLLYFLRQAHGTGPSYRSVTITALRDGAAWERLARRVEAGDLRDWSRYADTLRHEVRAKLLAPLPWSPLQTVDLANVPTAPAEHAASLFMEDTVWPFEGRLDDYIERAGSHYAREMRSAREHLLTVDASFRTLLGSHRRREIVLWQKVVHAERLVPLLTRELPAELDRPGTWMHDALDLRDQWESRLLRTAAWSPCY